MTDIIDNQGQMQAVFRWLDERWPPARRGASGLLGGEIEVHTEFIV
jgi:hypothetical protein